MANTFDVPTCRSQWTANVNLANTLGVGKFPVSVDAAIAYLSGGAANQVDAVHAEKYSIGPSATLTLDLNDVGGSLKDPAGAPVTFARVYGMVAVLGVDNGASGIKVGGNANPVPIFDTAATTKTLNAVPGKGAKFEFAQGDPGVLVTAATGDKIDVVNLDSVKTAVVNVMIVGRKT